MLKTSTVSLKFKEAQHFTPVAIQALLFHGQIKAMKSFSSYSNFNSIKANKGDPTIFCSLPSCVCISKNAKDFAVYL